MTIAHPILFTGAMVRAIMEGRKTQTRRVVRPALWPAVEESARINGKPAIYMLDYDLPCPYGEIGDALWARETWAYHADEEGGGPGSTVFYRADGDDGRGSPHINGWRPSIHMPRWACRITLKITDVRVERVQDTTEADARAEGVTVGLAKWEFHEIWDSINAGRGYGWDVNPWVWAITFERVEAKA
jgi:hypothetical protein